MEELTTDELLALEKVLANRLEASSLEFRLYRKVSTMIDRRRGYGSDAVGAEADNVNDSR